MPETVWVPDARFTLASLRIIAVECPRCGKFNIDQARLDDFLEIAR